MQIMSQCNIILRIFVPHDTKVDVLRVERFDLHGTVSRSSLVSLRLLDGCMSGWGVIICDINVDLKMYVCVYGLAVMIIFISKTII